MINYTVLNAKATWSFIYLSQQEVLLSLIRNDLNFIKHCVLTRTIYGLEYYSEHVQLIDFIV